MSGCQIFYFSKNVCIGFNLIVQSKISSTKYEYTKNIKKKKCCFQKLTVLNYIFGKQFRKIKIKCLPNAYTLDLMSIKYKTKFELSTKQT